MPAQLYKAWNPKYIHHQVAAIFRFLLELNHVARLVYSESYSFGFVHRDQMDCIKCGSNDFTEEDGFYFCVHCQTQSQVCLTILP